MRAPRPITRSWIPCQARAASMPSTESKSGWGQGGVVNGVSKDLLDLRISEFLAVGGVPQDAVSVTAFTGREGIVKQINPQSYVLIIYSYDDMQYLPLELPGLKTVSLWHTRSV